MKQDTAKPSQAYCKDTLVKLQAMQNSKNNTRQVYLFGCLFLLFYTATAVQRDVAQRNRAGAGLILFVFYRAIARHEQAHSAYEWQLYIITPDKFTCLGVYFCFFIGRQPSSEIQRSVIELVQGYKPSKDKQRSGKIHQISPLLYSFIKIVNI